MAKRKYKKRKTAKKRASNIDLAVVGLIVLSILLAVLIYGKSGVIGVTLSEILGGMMGIIKYILPIGIFALGIKIATEDNEYISSRLVHYAILLLSFSVLMSVYQIGKGDLTIFDKQISEIVKEAYHLGTQESGGGALGAIIATPLVKLLGKGGAAILGIGAVAMLAVFTFGINMSEIINNAVERTKEKREDRLEARKQFREEQIKLRQEEMENRKIQKELMKQQSRQEALSEDSVGEQIKINFGGRIMDDDDKKGRKKYDHKNDDLIPLTKETNKMEPEKIQPDVIENNLFRQEEEKKEDKTKEVLQLEHAMVVEDENYEYPPIELLGKPAKKALKGGAKALTDTATKLQKTL